jgi:hypothetical protein
VPATSGSVKDMTTLMAASSQAWFYGRAVAKIRQTTFNDFLMFGKPTKKSLIAFREEAEVEQT